MDLLDKFLNGSPPYISQLVYDLDKREIIVRCWNNKGFKFKDVTAVSEEQFEDSLDTDLEDSIMGLHLISEGRYCINTEKRELIIETQTEPFPCYY